MGWLRTFQPSRVYSALESYSSEHAVYDADRSACRELNVGQVFVRERKKTFCLLRFQNSNAIPP